MMKVAFSQWENRIAPVFDTARQIRLVEVDSGEVVGETQEILPYELPVQNVLRLVELTVGTLVCGAISRPLRELVTAYGIRVIPFVAGELKEVVEAWLRGGLRGADFAMPGCFERGRHRVRGKRHVEGEEHLPTGKIYGVRGPGRGYGQGRDGRNSGRRGGVGHAGIGGVCVCPVCGQRQPNGRGTPCVDRRCPRCGAAMILE